MADLQINYVVDSVTWLILLVKSCIHLGL